MNLSSHYIVCMHVKLLYFLKRKLFCQHVYYELNLKRLS